MNIIGSAFGHYEPVGHPEDADVIVGHSFGTSVNKGSVNRELADLILDIADGRPVVVDRNLADSIPDFSAPLDKVVDGPISNTVGVGVGTWGTLVAAQEFMAERQLVRPMMVAQAFHIGRIAMQAKKLHMDSIIPANLPTSFDEESDQIWTRSRAMWVPREVLGSFVLKAQGKL
jgi:hypothetical protein